MMQASDPLDDLVTELFAVARAVGRPADGAVMDKASLLVLSALADSGPSRPSACAEKLYLDQSTISRHLKSLEESGLVHRSPDPQDGRAHLFAPTAAGARHVAEHRQSRRERLAVALANWSPDDQRTVTHLLARLAADLQTTPALESV